MRTKETQVDDFAGLVSATDSYDLGAVAGVIVTNFELRRQALMNTRAGYKIVTFSEEE